MSKNTAVGQRVPRVDAIEKVTGQAMYGDDLAFQNVLYAKAVRSPHAHARILNIDAGKAQKLFGVKAIAIGKDLPVLGGEALKDYPFLAVDKVRYVGDPVVAVAAIDERIAEEAVDLIKVEYEELPPVLDPLKAMESGAPLVHENLHLYKHIPVIKPVEHTNICHHVQFIKGDVKQGFDESDLVFEDTFTTQMIQHGAIEPHMAVAQVDPSGRVTVWVTNDGPHRLRNDLASALGIPLSKVRVISPPYMGGGFGGKGGLKMETICIALALKTNGRPVKMVLTREEVFTASLVRHPSVVRVKTGVKKDGTMVAREVNIVYDTGAYAEKGPTVCEQASTGAVGPYRIPHVKVDGYCVYTNKTIAGAYRGYGIPQVNWAYESQMDIIAERLGIDPVEIRMKNAVEEGDTSPTGQQVLHSVGVKECIQKVAQTIAWDDKPDKKFRGKGIACGYKNTKTPSGSSAIVKISQDGSVEVLSSTVEIGQGSKTILSQVAAETLGTCGECNRGYSGYGCDALRCLDHVEPEHVSYGECGEDRGGGCESPVAGDGRGDAGSRGEGSPDREGKGLCRGQPGEEGLFCRGPEEPLWCGPRHCWKRVLLSCDGGTEGGHLVGPECFLDVWCPGCRGRGRS